MAETEPLTLDPTCPRCGGTTENADGFDGLEVACDDCGEKIVLVCGEDAAWWAHPDAEDDTDDETEED
jgi:rRNA maturation protein Nop10